MSYKYNQKVYQCSDLGLHIQMQEQQIVLLHRSFLWAEQKGTVCVAVSSCDGAFVSVMLFNVPLKCFTLSLVCPLLMCDHGNKLYLYTALVCQSLDGLCHSPINTVMMQHQQQLGFSVFRCLVELILQSLPLNHCRGMWLKELQTMDGWWWKRGISHCFICLCEEGSRLLTAPHIQWVRKVFRPL